jgi:cobalt-zinc-cadmium efflux system membrane fusion protein
MKNRLTGLIVTAIFCLLLSLTLAGCKHGETDEKAEAPPSQVTVVPEMNANNFKIEHPEQFTLATATERKAAPELNVTGVVQPDIARAVPVISIATGRVVEIHARLGDTVKKGQLLLKVRSNDVNTAFQAYLHAENDERMNRLQYERSKTLYEHGAISQAALEQAEAAAADTKADLNTAIEQLHLLGVDKDHPSGIVDIFAPISGVITDQVVTNAAGVQGLSGPNPFTISDLSFVWVICDVYENDMDAVHVGEYADVRLNAYPDKVLKARIDNILPTMDPSLRTAKVRLELANPGIMRIGMFATATFFGKKPETRTIVPATAILHIHDRDWIFAPQGNGAFQRKEVKAGNMLPGGMQEIVSGLAPGAQVVQNALAMQNTVEQ